MEDNGFIFWLCLQMLSKHFTIFTCELHHKPASIPADPLSCAWGKANEDKAVSAYLQSMQEKGHSGIEVAPSGLVINPKYAWLGVSADGLVTDPHSPDPNGLLEIKCPYKF